MGSSRRSSASTAEVKEEPHVPHNAHGGMHWVVAGVFIIGEMAGGGLVAMPSAILNAGLICGIIFTILGALSSGYTGIQLGDNWMMMQERWSEYQEHCRNPYQEMAFRAMGTKAQMFLNVLIAVQQFCVPVVFLILAASNLSAILKDLFNVDLNFCYLTCIIGVALLPLIMLGSPKDFWQIGVIAMTSTSLAIILLLVGMGIDTKVCYKAAYYPSIEFKTFSLSYGTIMFAFGGHSVFPTIQHDMKKPELFNRSVWFSYIAIIIMYLPLSIFGYVIYGDSLRDSVLRSIQTKWIQSVVTIMITLHVTFTIVILLSPFSQGAEMIFKVPDRFGVRRVIVRTIIMLAVIFIALTFPNFGVFLDLVGGTTVTNMTMVLPGLFYLSLLTVKKKRADEGRPLAMVDDEHHHDHHHDDRVKPVQSALPEASWSTEEHQEQQQKNRTISQLYMPRSPQFKEFGKHDYERATVRDVFKYNPWWLIAINVVVILVGILGGIASTASAIFEMISGPTMPAPCYVQLFQGKLGVGAAAGDTYCCGHTKDIVSIMGVNATDFCAAP